MKRLSLIAAVMLLAIAMQSKAQTNNQPGCYPYPKTISVTGSAEMEIIPDEIYVQVDLREYKKRGEDKVELDKIKADFLANCKAVGIADSNISIASYDGYNMSALWQRRKKDPELLASISYQIKFSSTKPMDELIDRLDDQATNNFRVVRTSHSKIVEYRKQLKIMAIKAAKEKAAYLTEAVNEQLGQAITILEPEESSSSDVQNGRYKSASNAKFRETENSNYAKGAYGIVDEGVDYRKLKLRYEVGVLFAIK